MIAMQHERVTCGRSDFGHCGVRAAQHKPVSELVVETASLDPKRNDSFGARSERMVERQLKVGGILIFRKGDDLGSFGFSPHPVAFRHRIEVAQQHVNRQTVVSCDPNSTIDRNDEIGISDASECCALRDVASDKNHCDSHASSVVGLRQVFDRHSEGIDDRPTRPASINLGRDDVHIGAANAIALTRRPRDDLSGHNREAAVGGDASERDGLPDHTLHIRNTESPTE